LDTRIGIVCVAYWLLVSCTQPVVEKRQKPTLSDSNMLSLDTLTAEVYEKKDTIHIPIDYDTILWSEVTRLDPRLVVDLRYASTNNFVEEKMYDCPRCFLRPEASIALQKVHSELIAAGYHLKLLDCYRPKSVQEKLWEKVPDATYVTPPKKGSMHNRGFAVDVTLIDAEGREQDMGSPFDFFGRRAHHDYFDLDPDILARRKLLKETMAKFGYKHIRTEWWHYSYQGPYKSPFKIDDFQWSCH